MAGSAQENNSASGNFQIINETESIIRGSKSGGLDSDDDNGLQGIDSVTGLAGAKSSNKKTRGRVKIEMKYIENKLRRYTTFSKRKTGIMKKAYELSTLTGTQVMLLVASETGHVYTFATRKLQPMITSETGKALIQTCLNSPDNVQAGVELAKSEGSAEATTGTSRQGQTIGLQENFSQHPVYPWSRPESTSSAHNANINVPDDDSHDSQSSQHTSRPVLNGGQCASPANVNISDSQKKDTSKGSQALPWGQPVYPIAQVQSMGTGNPPSAKSAKLVETISITPSITGLPSVLPIINGLPLVYPFQPGLLFGMENNAAEGHIPAKSESELKSETNKQNIGQATQLSDELCLQSYQPQHKEETN